MSCRLFYVISHCLGLHSIQMDVNKEMDELQANDKPLTTIGFWSIMRAWFT